MAKRHDLRQRYIDGWYEKDVDKLVSSIAPGFIFDDPAEPHPVTADNFTGYIERWYRRTEEAGAANEWVLRDEVRQDRDGVLIDWEQWELVGTDLSGMAVIRTSDDGVLLERITYFDRHLRV